MSIDKCIKQYETNLKPEFGQLVTENRDRGCMKEK